MKVTAMPIVIVCSVQSSKDWFKGRRNRKKRMSGDYPNDGIVEIGLNIEKNHEDLRTLAVTQIPVENNQMSKILILIIIMEASKKKLNLFK